MRRILIALFMLCAAHGMQAQKLTDVQKQGSPLVLKNGMVQQKTFKIKQL